MNQSPIISADWLSNRTTQAALALLSDAGHQAYVVGGAVRNQLMGHAVGDIDIATDATPQQVIELAQAASVKCVETGVEHGTITLILSGESYEVTSFRRDVETHGRRATVAFGTSLTEDAMRRDFTINARVCCVLSGRRITASVRIIFVFYASSDFMRIMHRQMQGLIPTYLRPVRHWQTG